MANTNSTDTLIGEKSVVEGNIISKASLRVEGKIVGDINCEGDVVIGKNAEARSNITARNVINAGTIIGTVKTRSMLTITSSGKLHGDIHVKAFTMAEGGVFIGACTMDLSPAADKAKQTDQQRTLQKVEKIKKTDAVKEVQEKNQAAAGH